MTAQPDRLAVPSVSDDDDLTTLWVRTEGMFLSPVLCAPKAEALAAGAALDAARITIPESEWAPCCRASFTNVACIRDAFADLEDHEVPLLRECAARAGIALPADIDPEPSHDDTEVSHG